MSRVIPKSNAFPRPYAVPRLACVSLPKPLVAGTNLADGANSNPSTSNRNIDHYGRFRAGSSHLVVGEKQNTFSNKSLKAAVCSF